MADRLEPTGFWSYSTIDDRAAGNRLSRLRVRLADELQLLVGRTKVQIFQDIAAIPHGAEWEQAINAAIGASSFMIPIVTPGFLQSEWCCREVLQFRKREIELGRSDLIFPFLYIDTGDVGPDRDDECFSPEVFHLLRSRQHADFCDLRYHDVEGPDVSRRLGALAKSVRGALGRSQPVVKPAPEADPPPASTPALAASPAPGTVIRDVPNGPELVLVPAGTFTMGVPPGEEDREGVPQQFRWSSPQKRVTIAQPFWLGRYPVTRGQFAAFIADEGLTMPDEAYTYEPDAKGEWTYDLRKKRGWRNPGFEQTDDHPVVCVSHADAEAYVKWLSRITRQTYRLPSEAEWEYACRAGTTTARFWGDGREEAVRCAKVADRSLMARMKASFDPERYFDGDSGHPFTAPVGSVRPNPFGLYDMLGNVWEWTADCWNDHLKDIPLDGSATTTGGSGLRALRGGSWYNRPRNVRAGNRDGYSTGYRDTYTGFRVARTLFSP
nr:SUMF1/EgtB/PvdO family nonheme iron enzyme [uncultured Rhodopila sp.]